MPADLGAIDAARFRRVSDTVRVGRSGDSEPEGDVENLPPPQQPHHTTGAGAAPPSPGSGCRLAGSSSAASIRVQHALHPATVASAERPAGVPLATAAEAAAAVDASQLVAVPGPARGHWRR